MNDVIIGKDGSTEYLRRAGTKRLYTLQPGENWIIVNNELVITHPEQPPKLVHRDGSIEVLQP